MVALVFSGGALWLSSATAGRLPWRVLAFRAAALVVGAAVGLFLGRRLKRLEAAEGPEESSP
jgi:uncharacterized membrane protein YfcA